METLLLAEDKESLARVISEALEPEGYRVEIAATGTEAVRKLASGRRFSFVLTDLRLPGVDGIGVLRASREHNPDCPVIVMTAYGTIEEAVEAMKLGAWDFVQKPVDIDYLALILRRAREHQALKSENLLLRQEFQEKLGLPVIIGDSAPMRELTRKIQRVAPTDSTVLLTGESGTGKELFARAIHALSPRKNRPFVAVNCAAIPDTLIENELFGHEKGSYTGAASRQLGKFELAAGGTVFLDEIGELALSVQSKILRVLQEHSFERIGGQHSIEADVRVVCATNRDLTLAISEGKFREDLFFRIHVFPVEVPSLRARKEDIRPLARFFASRYAAEVGKREMSIGEEAWSVLMQHDWPGNVRELENAIERAVILADGQEIAARDLQLIPTAMGGSLRQVLDLSGTLGEAVGRASERVEREKISEVLRETRDRQLAAERLGITARTLASKMRHHGIDDDETS
ncbi:MAG TPA: sigma-54 dependent transcriptional regulator [Thermoanaerobaculia bacterium]|nr:sigma-54 dependent transcriptional regulator [Thermoanaerobaculia bacterium]